MKQSNMKTKVKIYFPARMIEGITIGLETKSNLMCVSDLQRAFNSVREQNGWATIDIEKIFLKKENQLRIIEMLKLNGVQSQYQIESSIKEPNGFYMDISDNQRIKKFLKSIGWYKTTGRGENRKTWANKYLWMLIAQEMSPKFYALTTKWATDFLLQDREDAGDQHKELCSWFATFNPKPEEYSRLSRGLNMIIFNQHYTNIRNTATPEQLKDLKDLMSKLAFMIEYKGVKSLDELFKIMIQMWNEKYNKTLKIK